ncbi:hypothetical protein AB1L88_17025 [Tautonia sp. JC769]|uniref:hypothetical protein n=1 Tax=Tautonia sp. JC769 TaxID=3232135 RepID=UPI0034587A1A
MLLRPDLRLGIVLLHADVTAWKPLGGAFGRCFRRIAITIARPWSVAARRFLAVLSSGALR